MHAIDVGTSRVGATSYGDAFTAIIGHVDK
jgi:hypothetical protein